MPTEIRHFCWRISSYSLKVLTVLAVLCAGVFAVFVWSVNKAPLDIGFAKPYIEAALHDPATGNYGKVDQVVLYWPALQGPLFIEMHNGTLFDKEGGTIISVDKAAMSFSRRGLFFGRIFPKSIILKKPTLRLIRAEDGGVKLDLGQNAPEEESKEQFDLTGRIFDYIARPGTETKKNSLISRLEAFSIEDARLFVDDRFVNKSWSLPDFNLGLHSTYTGLKGFVRVSLPDIGLESSALNLDMNYVWEKKIMQVQADFKNIDVQAMSGTIPELDVLGPQNIIFNAKVETVLDENFMPEEVSVDITSEEGSIMHPDLSEDPIPYKDLSLHAFYNYTAESIRLRDTKITLKDITVFAEADIAHEEDTLQGPVKLWINEVEQSQIGKIWPVALRGDNSEKWIVERLSDGTFQDVWLKFDLLAEKKQIPAQMEVVYGPARISREPTWRAGFQNLEGEFSFTDMSVDYRAPLDKVTQANGSGRFDMNKDELTVDVENGKLGTMSVKSAKLLLDKVVAVGEGDADIKIDLNGGVKDILKYLSEDPVNLDDDIKMDIDKVAGDADLKIWLHFPAQKDVRLEDFEIGVTGILDEVLFPDVLDDLDLSGGPLDFALKDGLVSMKGTAMIEKRPVALEWETFLRSEGKPYKEKLMAKLNVDPNIREMLGIDLSEFIEGSVFADVSYVEQRDGTGVADISVDATSALFFVDPFDFEKPPGKKATGKFKAHLDKGTLLKITDLTANGDEFTISKSDMLFKTKNGKTELSSGNVPAFTLKETKAKLDFKYNDAGAVKINMDASFLDVQPFMDAEEQSGEYNESPMVITVNAKEMRTSPEETVTQAKLHFDIDDQGAFNTVEIDAKVGAGSVFVRFVPDEQGKRTFTLKADDAGAFLKAFQVYNDIKGGTLMIYGEPVRDVLDRDIRGKAEIRDFKVVRAPFLTKILSLLSLTGIGDVLGGDGLDFEKLEADFSWLYRKQGSLLVLKNGTTSGNSLGLLFDGTFDNEKRVVDVSGTVVPMSGLNKVIGKIPLIGDILTGGSGGVFAATYSIKGPSDDPKILVNPLSVLTPGIIRRILFE